MLDKEIAYDVLAELYFVTSYKELAGATGLTDEILKSALINLFKKDWIRCYDGVDNEVLGDDADLVNRFSNYHYLASKAGLFAHNTI